MNGHVFFSHGSENADQADKLVAYLEARGLKIWISPRDVRPGLDYSEQLQEAVETCVALAVLVTDKANKSPYVRAETEMAFSIGKPIFPVRFNDIQPAPGLALFLKIRHWTDAYGPKRSENLHRLAQELRALRADYSRKSANASRDWPLHIGEMPDPPLDEGDMRGGSSRSLLVALAAWGLMAVLVVYLLFLSIPPLAQTRSTQDNFSTYTTAERFQCGGLWAERWSIVSANFVPPGGVVSNRLRVGRQGTLNWNGTPVSESRVSEYLSLISFMQPPPTLIVEADQEAPCRIFNRMIAMANRVVHCTPALCHVAEAAK